ncbi:MAG: endonuclease Q family protein [Promethearchaeota archaeon]
MNVNLDLHYHSGASGAVGKIRLADFLGVAPMKGISVVGTGDCLHAEGTEKIKTPWLDKLRGSLEETSPGSGLFTLHGRDDAVKFLLQTEVIFTCTLAGKKKRKSVHVLLLFPSFEAVNGTVALLERWGVKNTIGRPFIKCEDNEEVGARLNRVLDEDDLVEFIPAHVMTPSGVFGSQNPIDHLDEFFGGATDRIHCVETGLSADPVVLGLIPELDDKGLVSNSDAHSIQLHRLGREFTSLELPRDFQFADIVKRFRRGEIARTGEFNPAEGKFFLSGHRAGKQGHGDRYCVFSPKYTPADGRCPICGKPLTIGVLERAMELSRVQGANREFGEGPVDKQEFVHMVPLLEILSTGFFRSKSTSTRRGVKLYERVVSLIGNECSLWFEDDSVLRGAMQGQFRDLEESRLVDLILSVKHGNFHYSPLGYDGTYGQLVIGEPQDPSDLFETNFVKGARQETLPF